ncbi:hypothetical protein OROHE_011055 [Orobanche hederae]
MLMGAIFQRYPQPEKEYQSFSLIYGRKSLDVVPIILDSSFDFLNFNIRKHKCGAEIWFVALRALVSCGNYQKWRTEMITDGSLSDCSR